MFVALVPSVPLLWKSAGKKKRERRKKIKIAKLEGVADLPVASVLKKIQGTLAFLGSF